MELLRPYDLYIKTVEVRDRDTESTVKKRLVAIKNPVAFDEDFIRLCEENGVKEIIEQPE